MLYEAFYDVLNPSGLLFKKIVPDNTIEDFLNGHEGKVYGVLTGYLHMDNSMKVKFGFEGKNLGFSLRINGLEVLGDFKEELIDFKGGFSLDGSIETARDQSQSSTKNVFVTELNCTTTYIEMDEKRIKFHPMFLKDLATIEQKSDLLKIFDKYGTYYYSSAYMGGKLVQISTTSESIDTDEKKSKWSIAAELTFGASAK
ncbi:hypothetical protein PPL_07803 [Heterostelium album PN500]|uniref:MACPF domain-containing protein n=1 Tax=Heterostelium pallidum (strain ATCC 26659 / Pp 5 / PN500) TaxID=670386 RepID=D3BH01_HETP5|nr:hypothetical protein PPL_07803 [Heterostelium album PN500]EFA79385.1 hypothetical protein PPL_07803 [Heterostelium album PN500]|eukprot:XP_020431506.1 hypothetical protein PPL_07803 [Heterostelium album PN500]